MARRELKERNELSGMWGLLKILESCQGCPSHKLISNGRPLNKHITDCPRKIDQLTSFDEECRKIQNVVDFTREKRGKMDTELVDLLVKRAMKKSRKTSSTYELPSTSDEVSLNKLKLAAILEASECFQRRVGIGTYAQVDEINMQMSAKAFADQMFINRRLICNEGASSRSESFSEALRVLNSNKNILMNLMPDQKSLATVKGKANKNVSKKIDHQPKDRIVILKPVPTNAKCSEDVNCHCSSMQLQRKSSRRVSDGKATSFSFREMKRKLKHTFGGNSDEVNVQTKVKLCNRQDLNSNRGSDISCISESVRKKLDWTKKQEDDVILEAKRHLSARLKKVNSVETVISVVKSPKTLARILSSPDHDFRPLSPRRDSQYFSTFDSSQSPLRSNTEDIKQSTLIPSTGISKGKNCPVSIVSPGESKIGKQNSMKCQEEHRSPVSVLEPFLTDDENSPPSISLQTDRQQTLKPFRLDFDNCSFDTKPTSSNCSMEEEIEEEDHISLYVHLVLEASCLTWDQLSEISSLPDELLESSLFDEVEFLLPDCYFDPKLLFDHINEVLLDIYQSHFGSSPWLTSVKPRIMSMPLAELVADEIMTEPEFYLLPRTERRTLDQLVSKDVAECRSWLDVRFDTERIAIDVADDVLEETILDVLLEFHT